MRRLRLATVSCHILRCRRVLTVVLAAAIGVLPAAWSAAQKAPPTRPAQGTGLPDKPRFENPKNREEKLVNLLDYLEKDYIKKTAAPFWVSRAMGVISLARSPRPTALPRLLELCEKDKNEVVKLLAWQAVLARAGELDAATHRRWITATLALAERDAFQGALRVPLLEALGASVPTARHRKIWMKIFEETSAWEPQDIPTLDALGKSLAAWKSLFLAQGLVKILTDGNAGVRAEYVLKAAGSPVQTARERLSPEVFNPQSPKRTHPSSDSLYKAVQADSVAWLNKEKWKEVTKIDGEPWKQLQPAFVPPPMELESIDPDDPAWLADLELGIADISDFEAVFVVDATGSMGDVLAWLRRDMARVMGAFGRLAKEAPRLGVVFYRDKEQGDPFVTKVLPLTMKLADLEPGLVGMDAMGGGDVPEAVREGLADAVGGMKWTKSNRTGKLVILVGDAPPKPGTEEDCKALARKAKEVGIRLHTVAVTNAMARNNLEIFAELAKEGGGMKSDAAFASISPNRYVEPDGREIPVKTIPRPETQLLIALSSADAPPGEQILTKVLTDVINPQYADRVQPLARTLLAHVQSKSEPEKRLPFPADTPPLGAGTLKPQGK